MKGRPCHRSLAKTVQMLACTGAASAAVSRSTRPALSAVSAYLGSSSCTAPNRPRYTPATLSPAPPDPTTIAATSRYSEINSPIIAAFSSYPTPNSDRAAAFFFSSRRRHTTSLRDWSSDVCSSDLESRGLAFRSRLREPQAPEQPCEVERAVFDTRRMSVAEQIVASIDVEGSRDGAREVREPEIGRASCRERV